MATVEPAGASTRCSKSSACWHPLVIRMSSSGPCSAFLARLIEQILPKRRKSGGRAELEDRRRHRPGDHFAAGRLKRRERELVLGGP